MEKKTSDAQIKATRRWEERNKERTNFMTARRQARRYIQQFAIEEDLIELENWIENKRENL